MKNKKRIVLMLSMALALGTITNTYAQNLEVDKVFGRENKVDYLKNHNFVKGYEDGDLKLDKGIKRSEITKLLVYANDGENIAKNLEKIQGSYKDVEINHWANGVINAATNSPVGKSGLFMINGYPDKTFKPEREITYAELAKMLVVLADDNLTEEDVKNADANWPNAWISKAQESGLLEDVAFSDVNKTVNREEAFTMFYNGIYEKSESSKEKNKEEVKEIKDSVEVKESKKRKKHKNNSSNNEEVIEEDKNEKTPEEKLKETFLNAAKAQTSLAENIYSLSFDGENLKVTFKESGLQNTPVEAVKTAANAMLDRVLEVVDEATITVNKEEVTVSKENKNIEALAKAFLGETGVEDFIKDGKVEVSFTTKISKGDVKDVEVEKVNATFAMDMDSTKKANQDKLIGVAKIGVENVVSQGSLSEYFKDNVSYDDNSKTATVTIAKDSKISELPQDGTKLMEALEAGLDLGTIEKLELKLDDENSIEIVIEDKEIAEVKSNILKEEKIKALLEKKLIDLKDKKFVLKASGEKLGEVEYTIKFEEAISGEKDSFHEAAKEAASKLVEKQDVIDAIDYENGKATVKLNADKLEDVNNMENLGTGLFSEILPELGVKSVKIGEEEFTVDPKAENFNLNKMVSAALETVDSETNTIKYSAKIVRDDIEFEENFEVKFELTGSKQTKEKNQEILERNIKELEDTAIRLLNQQGRFNLEKVSENEINFTFLTNGNPGGFFGKVHDQSSATRETSMGNYTRGSGLATVLGQKPDESGKKQKERIEKIKPLLDLETMTIDGEKFDGLSGMSQIYKMKVGDFLGTKTLKVKVKDIVSGNEYIEYVVNFKLPNEINKDESQLKSELNAKTEVKSEAPMVEKAEVAEVTVEAEAEEVETEVK